MLKTTHNDKEHEREILNGFLSGSREGARVFFEEYEGIIKKAVDSVKIKDRAVTKEDLFMAAVENLLKDDLKAIRSFKGESKFSTYIYTICLRYAVDLTGRTISPGPDPDTLLDPESLFEEVGVFDEKERQALEKAIPLCNPRERIFISKIFKEERSTKEIMDFFKWKSTNTVYSQKNKVINKLRRTIRCGLFGLE